MSMTGTIWYRGPILHSNHFTKEHLLKSSKKKITYKSKILDRINMKAQALL